jgi:CTP:molybdopterin cytidylyltransferase MocA
VSSVAGLVLAAGEGRRLGGPKALLEIAGERLVDRAVRALRVGGCTPVYVVAGAAPLVVPDVVVVDNPAWVTGMASSLHAGLAALTARGETAAVIMVVDTPGIGPEVVRRLLAARTAGATAAVATYGGQPRNPMLIARQHWDEVIALTTGDVGARAFLARHPDAVARVACDDLADPSDIDTPQDLERAVEALRRSSPR